MIVIGVGIYLAGLAVNPLLPERGPVWMQTVGLVTQSSITCTIEHDPVVGEPRQHEVSVTAPMPFDGGVLPPRGERPEAVIGRYGNHAIAVQLDPMAALEPGAPTGSIQQWVLRIGTSSGSGGSTGFSSSDSGITVRVGGATWASQVEVTCPIG